MDDMTDLAAAWWESEGTTAAFDRVYGIVQHRHDLVGGLIAALAEAAPIGALSFIGTAVVEDLSFQVDDGDLSGEEASRLILGAGLPSPQLFEILSGAYADRLQVLDLTALPLSPAQLAWLLDEAAEHRRPSTGRVLAEGPGFRFDPERTPWQAELSRRTTLT